MIIYQAEWSLMICLQGLFAREEFGTMDIKHVPVSFGSFSTDPANLIPVAIAVIVGVVILMGARRELATFAVAAGVIGAILAT